MEKIDILHLHSPPMPERRVAAAALDICTSITKQNPDSFLRHTYNKWCMSRIRTWLGAEEESLSGNENEHK